MRHILAAILFFLSSYSFIVAQTKEISIPERIIGYSGGNYVKAEKRESSDFKIKRLTVDTSFDEFYRIQNRKQIIEVWRTDTNYFGQVINFTRAIRKNLKAEKESEELLFNKVSLKKKSSKKIFNETSKIKDIPDMDEIQGWAHGYDGETFSIEFATKSKYSIRSYWEPGSQNDSIQYKADVAGKMDYLFNKLNLTKYYDSFFNTLPDGEYTDGFFYTIKSSNFQKFSNLEKQ